MSPIPSSPDISGPSCEDGSRVPRKQVACERCKRRKARCDRQFPECTRCLAATVPCEYANRRPPGFPTGHRQLLEDKIRRLEGELAKARGPSRSTNGSSEVTGREDPRVAATTDRSEGDARDSLHLDPGLQSNEIWQAYQSANASSVPGENQYLAPTVVRTSRIKEQKPPDDLVLSLTSLYFRHIHHWLPFLDIRHVFEDHGSFRAPSLIAYALFGATLQYSHDPRLTQSNKDAYWKYSKRTILVEALEEPSYQALEALTVLVLDLSGMTNGPQVWGVLAVAVKMAQQLGRSNTGHSLRISSAAGEEEQYFKPDAISVQRLFWAIYALDCFVSITTKHASEFSFQLIQHLLPSRGAIWRDEAMGVGGTGIVFNGQPSPASHDGNNTTPSVLSSQGVFGYQLDLLDISRNLHTLYISSLSLETTSTLPEGWYRSVSESSSLLDDWYTRLPPSLKVTTEQGRASPLVATLNAYYYALRIYLYGLIDVVAQKAQEAHPQVPSGRLPQSLRRHHNADEHVSPIESDWQTGSYTSETIPLNFIHSGRFSCIASVERLSQIQVATPHTERVGWPLAWALWIGGRYCLAARYQDWSAGPESVGSESYVPGSARPEHFSQLLESLDGLSKYWQVSSNYLRLLRHCHDELSLLENGSTAAPSRLLLLMVDWRVASSEVEDQGRVDPILRSTSDEATEGVDFNSLELFLGNPIGVELNGSSYQDLGNGGITDWFCMA